MYGKTEEELTKSKLYILYLLNMVDEPFSNINITQTFVETDIIEYFPLQQYLFELENSSFISKMQVEQKDYYHITERGKSALNYFENRMLGIDKKKLEEYLEENLSKFNRYKEIKADYSKNVETGNTEVVLQLINKDKPFINLMLEVPTAQTAKAMCKNWDQFASDIYAEIITVLTQKREANK